MTFHVKCKWTATEIPPRCRKPRTVSHSKIVHIDIIELCQPESKTLMPVALIIHNELYREEDAKHHPLYLFQDRLYEVCENYDTPEKLQAHFDYDGIYVDSEAEISDRMEELAKTFVIRDGVVYGNATEPIYQVDFGFNGPSIFIRDAWNDRRLDDREFRADELDYAIKAALSGPYALEDSRREWIENTATNTCYIDVYLPEALKQPSYLNRLAINIEQKVKDFLIHDFRFDSDQLASRPGQRLTQELCKNIYDNPEFQKQQYLIHSFDIRKIAQEVILKRF